MPFGLIGNPVEAGTAPATVNADEIEKPLYKSLADAGTYMGRV